MKEANEAAKGGGKAGDGAKEGTREVDQEERAGGKEEERGRTDGTLGVSGMRRGKGVGTHGKEKAKEAAAAKECTGSTETRE